jgi:hypothetical protein
MSHDPAAAAAAATPDRFGWHPTYRGRTLAEVRAEIGQELARDQRAYRLVLEGAEKEENAALAGILDLERKWGAYDLDWAEADAAPLADRIAAFELERDRRRELFPFAAYRGETLSAAGSGPRPPVVPAGSSGGRWPVPLSLLVVVALAIILLLLFVLT